jgi:hypothetical protein
LMAGEEGAVAGGEGEKDELDGLVASVAVLALDELD